MKIEFLNSIKEISDRFDAFIIDLWGVLHDGSAPYPGALDALKNLRKENKKIILLSNAPRQSWKVEKVLKDLGFSRDLYDHVVTSGQVAHDYLRDWVPGVGGRVSGKEKAETRSPEPKTQKKILYYYIGPERDMDLIADLKQYEMTDDAAKAEFMIGAGFDNPGDGFETKQPQIDAALKNNLLFICPNPDRVVVKQDGRVWLCPGTMVEYYEKHGGKTLSFGKPYEQVYEQCFTFFKELGIGNWEKICAIGDSLHTDIAGANNVRIFSVLCTGGILAKELGIKNCGEFPEKSVLEKLCKKESAKPDSVISSFLW